MTQKRWLACLLLVLTANQGAAEDAFVEFASGASQVTLIELFTSEGCSSCPPAERWLNNLESDPGLWHDFVPVAWHVDYWDYLGWKDPFADPAHAKRQRRYAAEEGARTVYTPGVFRNGRAWSDWRAGGRIASRRSSPGNLVVRREGDRITARFEPTSANGARMVLNVAVLGMGFETEVRAGENRGRALSHEFVLIGQGARAMTREGNHYVAETPFPVADHATQRTALVAWVSTRASQRPVQAVGGFLTPSR